MEIDAAVTHEEGGPFTIETVEIDGPQGDEVLVEVSAAGLCHTDLSVRDQYYPTPLPAVLGHGGSGIVRELGEDVTLYDFADIQQAAEDSESGDVIKPILRM